MVLVEVNPEHHANGLNGWANHVECQVNGVNGTNGVKPVVQSAALHRDLDREFLTVASSEGNYLILENGRRIFDASGGPSVGCLGWGNKRVAEAMTKQILAAPYSGSVFYTTKVHEDLCQDLVNSTNGEMSRAYIVNSGSSPAYLVWFMN